MAFNLKHISQVAPVNLISPCSFCPGPYGPGRSFASSAFPCSHSPARAG